MEATILTTQEKRKWNELLENFSQKDIYFTPEYLEVFEKTTGKVRECFDGEVKLFFYGNEDNYIIYPFFKRDISILDFYEFFPGEEKVYDISSPYGFVGPLAKVTDRGIEKGLWKNFLQEFHNYCLKENIITEFARLNPFLKNHLSLIEFSTGMKKFERRVIYVDLTTSAEDIWKNLEKRNRNAITKARREKVKVERSRGQGDLETFYELYNRTMEGRKAKEEYFFPREFYTNLFNSLKEKVSLFLAKFRDKIITASLFLSTDKLMHYYLSGSDYEFLKKCPNNLLLYEAISWAKEEGYEIFDLGGGYQGEDSLHKFKASFSKTTLDFYTYRKIHNEEIYRDLCRARDKFYNRKKGREEIKTDYFPEYRK